VLAWRRSDGLEVQYEDGYPAWPARPLLRGRVTVDVDDGSWLRARLRGRSAVALGEAASPCVSSSGCSGVNRIQIAGRFAAARSWDADPVAEQYVGAVTVADTRTRSRRTTCRSEQVHEYVLTDDGAMACLVDVGEFPHTQEIRSEGDVLDAGTGIAGLHRRGAELVWRHDGAERTAPLPRRG
jgi:hypothetical protein